MTEVLSSSLTQALEALRISAEGAPILLVSDEPVEVPAGVGSVLLHDLLSGLVDEVAGKGASAFVYRGVRAATGLLRCRTGFVPVTQQVLKRETPWFELYEGAAYEPTWSLADIGRRLSGGGEYSAESEATVLLSAPCSILPSDLSSVLSRSGLSGSVVADDIGLWALRAGALGVSEGGVVVGLIESGELVASTYYDYDDEWIALAAWRCDKGRFTPAFPLGPHALSLGAAVEPMRSRDSVASAQLLHVQSRAAAYLHFPAPANLQDALSAMHGTFAHEFWDRVDDSPDSMSRVGSLEQSIVALLQSNAAGMSVLDIAARVTKRGKVSLPIADLVCVRNALEGSAVFECVTLVGNPRIKPLLSGNRWDVAASVEVLSFVPATCSQSKWCPTRGDGRITNEQYLEGAIAVAGDPAAAMLLVLRHRGVATPYQVADELIAFAHMQDDSAVLGDPSALFVAQVHEFMAQASRGPDAWCAPVN